MKIRRLEHNPIIGPHMDARMGDNINGPSLVRAPAWVSRPPGAYLLYFGHHRGTYIRLAHADRLTGPWRTHELGVLDLGQTGFEGHIASPDALVDEARREVRLYFHGLLAEGDRWAITDGVGAAPQGTRVAISRDGRQFDVLPELLGGPYFRVFQWQGWYYAFAMPGTVYRSRDGLTGFERGHNPFAGVAPLMRHCALLRRGDVLHVFYSDRGDCPERILVTTIDLTRAWGDWRATAPVALMEPELPWEGADEPLVPSEAGPIEGPARQLRDPAVFEKDGRTYLLYAVAGEQGIAIAELLEQG